MKILCSDGTLLSEEMMAALEEGAKLCVQHEGIDPERVEISLTFADKAEIRELNKKYRAIDNHTDVLSFPLIEDFEGLPPGGDILLGDVVICLEKAEEQAKEYGHAREREIAYLFIHSVCHLLGYDHLLDQEKKEMRRLEEKVLSHLELERRP